MTTTPAARTAAPAARTESAQRAFSTSMSISAARCLLTYVVLPFVTPLVGALGGVGPVLGLVLGGVALVANAASIRRFWAAQHPWRVPVTVVHVGVIVLVSILVALDVAALAG